MLVSEYMPLSHSIERLTTRPQPVPVLFRYRLLSSASSFNSQYPVFFLRSSSNFLRPLCRLPVTSILPLIFHLVTCFRRHLLRQMRLIHLTLLLFIVCRIFLSFLTLCNTSTHLTRSVKLIFFILLQHHISKHSRYS